MAYHTWTDREKLDALECDSYLDFRTLHPHLSNKQWRDARYRFKEQEADLRAAVKAQEAEKPKRGGNGANTPKPVFEDFEPPEGVDWREGFEVLKELQRLYGKEEKYQRKETISIPTEDSRPIAISLTSCAHLGGRFTHYEAVKRYVESMLTTPGVYLGSLGDEIEGYVPDFRSAEAKKDQLLSLQLQVALLNSLFGNLAEEGRLLWGVEGQHSGGWMRQVFGGNPIKDAFVALEVPYFEGPTPVEILVGEQKYLVIVAHQLKGHSIYNPLHPHLRAVRWNFPSADAVVMGDKHQYAYLEMVPFPNEVEMDRRASPYFKAIQVGTAKTGPDPYTVRGGWPLGWFDWPFLVLWPDRHCVKVTRDWDDVYLWMGLEAPEAVSDG